MNRVQNENVMAHDKRRNDSFNEGVHLIIYFQLIIKGEIKVYPQV